MQIPFILPIRAIQTPWFHCFLPRNFHFVIVQRAVWCKGSLILCRTKKKKTATIYTNTHRGGIRLDVSSYIIFLTPSAATMLLLLLWVLRVYCDKWKIYYHNIRGFSISTLWGIFYLYIFWLDVCRFFYQNRPCLFLVRGSYTHRFLPKYLSPMKSNEKWHSYGARSLLIKLTQFVWISYVVRSSVYISSL